MAAQDDLNKSRQELSDAILEQKQKKEYVKTLRKIKTLNLKIVKLERKGDPGNENKKRKREKIVNALKLQIQALERTISTGASDLGGTSGLNVSSVEEIVAEAYEKPNFGSQKQSLKLSNANFNGFFYVDETFWFYDEGTGLYMPFDDENNIEAFVFIGLEFKYVDETTKFLNRSDITARSKPPPSPSYFAAEAVSQTTLGTPDLRQLSNKQLLEYAETIGLKNKGIGWKATLGAVGIKVENYAAPPKETLILAIERHLENQQSL